MSGKKQEIHTIVVPVSDEEVRMLRKVPCRITQGSWGNNWVGNALVCGPRTWRGSRQKALLLEDVEVLDDLLCDLRARQPRPKAKIETDLFVRLCSIVHWHGLPVKLAPTDRWEPIE